MSYDVARWYAGPGGLPIATLAAIIGVELFALPDGGLCDVGEVGVGVDPV